MTISPIYPVILQNGTVADANQVMANFFQIQTDVNTNAAHNGANTDITSLEGLTTPIPITEGGTGATNASDVRDNLGITAIINTLVTVPLGATITWNSPTNIPTDFMEENGQALSRTTYAPLFAIIGTAFGAGDGSTTFNIPDSRGEFDRGWDNGRGVDPARVFGSTQAGSLASHIHTSPPHSHALDYKDQSGNPLASADIQGLNIDISGPYAIVGPPAAQALATLLPNTKTTAATVDATGGSETRPTNIARMKIIRVS